ncbi:MAG: Card1-like endonuclease domain-containing protein [Thermoguttaceae bacterium]
MTVLLCLLSDQHVPNLLSVHHFQPDHLVLVESDGMQKKHAARHLLAALRMGGCDYDQRNTIQPLEAEDNLEAVGRALRRAFGRCAAEDWIVNLSGGTKPMSIAAYEFFKALGARLVYINVPRPNELLGLDGRPTEICGYRPSVNEFLAGYGFEPRKKPDDIADAESRARQSWSCARRIAAVCPPQSLLNLGDLQEPENKKRWDQARKKGLSIQRDQLGPLLPELRDAIREGFGLEPDGDSLRGQLDKYGVEFLTGGWLEVFLWGLLERHAESLGIWDVRLGLQPGKIGIDTSSDFDVAFMHRYRLAIVECKSGAQEHDPGADVLHKLEAVVRQFRALLVNSYLATTSSNVLDKEGQLRPAVRNRAAIYGSRIVDRRGIQRLAENPDAVDLVRETFFGVPDSQ